MMFNGPRADHASGPSMFLEHDVIARRTARANPCEIPWSRGWGVNKAGGRYPKKDLNAVGITSHFLYIASCHCCSHRAV